MNKVYRIVWNAVSHTWVVASEFAKGRKKADKPSHTIQLRSAALALGLLGGVTAHAATIATPAQATNGQYSGTSTSASATGGDATAVGAASKASAQGATALGAVANASGVNSTAVGIQSIASGTSSLALGYQANAAGNYATAIGAQANALGIQSIVLGTQASTVTGALNAIAIGTSASAQGASSIVIGNSATMSNTGSGIVIGKQAKIDGTLGNSAATGDGSIAMGNSAYAYGLDATAIGAGASVSHSGGIALGYNASATGNGGATAIGSTALASNVNSTAIGTASTASATNSVALGAGSTTTANLATAGYNPGSTALSGIASAAKGEVSVGSSGNERRVTNVAAGATATDAVNVSQLQSEDVKVNKGFTDTATALGAGASYNSTTGAVGAPSYKLNKNTDGTGGTTYNNVGDALTNIDSRTTTNTTNIANNSTAIFNLNSTVAKPITFAGNSGSVAKKLGETLTIQGAATTAGSYSGANLQTQVDGSGNLQLQMADNLAVTSVTVGNTRIDSNGVTITDGPSMTTGGISASGKKVTNVAQGQLSSTSTDAVNGAQLNATNDAVAGNTTTINNLAGDTSTTYVTDNGTGIKYARTNDTGLAAGDAHATVAGATALGYEATASHANSVALGANSLADGSTLNTQAYLVGGTAGGEVSVGATGNTRRITNLAAGANDTDAVNVSQLKATVAGSVADAVMYDDTTHNNSTLGGTAYDSATGTGGTKLSNVAKGTADSDAVNVAQLKDAGLIDGSGNALNAVTYDDATKGSITLGGTASTDGGLTGGAKIRNVAQGALSATSADAVNGAQLNDTNNRVTTAEGNIATNTTNITNLGNTVNNLGDSVTTLADTPITFAGNSGSVAKKLGDTMSIQGAASTAGSYSGANLQTQVDGSGNLQLQMADNLAVTSVTAGNTTINNTGLTINGGPSVTAGGIDAGGQKISNVVAGTADSDAATVGQVNAAANTATVDAVKYDDATHGQVTLGNTVSTDGGLTGGTKLTNVAQGTLSTTSTDAVNGTQLNATNNRVTTAEGNIATNTTNITTLGNTVNNLGDSVTTLAATPITFAGNTGSVAKKLGDTMSIQGQASTAGSYSGANLQTQVDGSGNLQLQMADNLAVTSVTAGNTTINNSGLTINGGPSVTTGGINAGGQKISNVANGTADSDAATMGQVTAAANTATVDAVKYDDATHGQVTLGNTVSTDGGLTGGTKLTNVAQGELSTTSTDAVNGAQLNATNNAVAGNTTSINNLAAGSVQYDKNADGSVNTGSVTLAGTNGTKISNVANGTSDNDAVNVSQLKDSGLIDGNGNTQKAVLFNGPNGEANVAGQKIVNVAAGDVSSTSTDAVNGSQLHGTAESVANALGGGAGVNTDGTISAPSYVVNKNSDGTGGTTYNNVGGAITNIDGRTTTNTTDISNITNQINNGSVGLVQQDATSRTITVGKSTDGTVVSVAGTEGDRTVTGVKAGQADNDAVNVSQLKSSGLVDGNGNALNAVTYDSAAKDSITLGGTSYNSATGTGGTTITNVAKGTGDSDAVNVSQLKDSGLIDGNGNTQKAVLFNGPNGEANVAGQKIVNVAAGDVSSTSTDAVNGAQLNDTNNRVTTAEGNIANNTTNINNLTNGTAGLVQQSAAGANLTVGKDTDGVAIDLADKDGKTRTLKNVTAGVDETDAVNVGQLKTSGLVDGSGNALDAVTYDAGSSRGVVTFGGANGTLLTNVRDGAIVAGSRDAVNGGQIAALNDNLQNQISGLGNQVTKIDNRVTNIEANGTGGASLPYVDGNASGSSSNNANAGSTAGVAVGYNANAAGDNASVLGQNATALGSYGTAIGNDSYAAGPNDTALGGNAKVHADGSVAVGANATVTSATATNAVAVGADTQVSAASGTAIGQGASVTSTATGAVALGQGSVADRANTVSVGVAGGERQIANVSAGTQQTDAVNVSQLQGVTSALGGGSTMSNGSVTAPTYNVAGGSYNNVGDALQGIDSKLNDQFDRMGTAINQVNRDANRGIASAAALVNNMPYLPGKITVNAGVAGYRGQSALGVGVSRWSNDGRVNVNAGFSSSGGAPIFRVGVGMVIGE
ncbi:YadA-like family protein [Dyella sp. Tek66A03]|uniref:YadA-like family protein n=1 Tax=Dyella sp. Tek66A03 TaxID=3458298 RepID=UPI00403E6B53